MKNTFTILLLSLAIISCTDPNKSLHIAEIKQLHTSIDSMKNVLNNKSTMKNKIATFFTFQDNNAEKAMNFYVELFDNSKIIEVKRWGKEGPVEEGKIMHATFELNGSPFMCSDSPPVHAWDFSPAVSNFIECESEDEIEKLFAKLAENGTVTMPLNNYGFSQKFGWVIDQFKVSWQLNLK